MISPGIYLVSRPKLAGSVTHYGVLMKRRDGRVRVVQFDEKGCRLLSFLEFADGGRVTVHRRVPPGEIRDALRRAEGFVREGSRYAAFTNNCEHAARWIVEGRRESPQAGRAGLLGLALLGLGLGVKVAL